MPGRPADDDLIFGAVVGIVDLVDIRSAQDCPPDPFVEGPLCWVLENPRLVEPIPMPGRLMLFEVADHLIQIKP